MNKYPTLLYFIALFISSAFTGGIDTTYYALPISCCAVSRSAVYLTKMGFAIYIYIYIAMPRSVNAKNRLIAPAKLTRIGETPTQHLYGS